MPVLTEISQILPTYGRKAKEVRPALAFEALPAGPTRQGTESVSEWCQTPGSRWSAASVCVAQENGHRSSRRRKSVAARLTFDRTHILRS